MLFKYVLHTKAFISIRYMPILITLIVHDSTDVRLVWSKSSLSNRLWSTTQTSDYPLWENYSGECS